jgi:hypothetical protein
LRAIGVVAIVAVVAAALPTPAVTIKQFKPELNNLPSQNFEIYPKLQRH